ncbi:unnamed protein product [Notodromas monacha]|uniref:Uncharacterized protein n=1 Tax=Notodromas monacha TaxID=399045 RepID=A0A7R9GLT8_9CRUS|nr:unnamed protein product [Notodromas monacha]CAG0926218.1 unnamed protein product [Notodromas monacha]
MFAGSLQTRDTVLRSEAGLCRPFRMFFQTPICLQKGFRLQLCQKKITRHLLPGGVLWRGFFRRNEWEIIPVQGTQGDVVGRVFRENHGYFHREIRQRRR